jgi:D-alanyl-D-alanine carboxypeptidase
VSAAGLADELHRALAQAASDPLVPGVMAAVHAPGIGFHWRAAMPGSNALNDGAWHPDLTFRIASVTKLFTAAAVFRLVEQGRLSLVAPIAGYVCERSAAALAGGGYDPSRINLSHLLAHTSGLPDHTHSPDYESIVRREPAHQWTALQQLEIAVSMAPPEAQPGQRFAYSDTGYVLAGQIVERASGLPLGHAVRELLSLDALGLSMTHWEATEPDPSPGRRARQCIAEVDATHANPSFDLYGGGGLVSTVADLCTFARALLQGRVFDSPPTLASALIVPMAVRPEGAYIHSRLAMALPMGQAWGWGHLGYWGCGVVCCPDLDVTVAASINQPYPTRADLRRELLCELGRLATEAAGRRAK